MKYGVIADFEVTEAMLLTASVRIRSFTFFPSSKTEQST